MAVRPVFSRVASGLLLAFVLAMTAAPVLAQPRVGRPGPGGGGPRPEDFRETLTILMMVRMKNELGLSKVQYEQLLPKIEEFESARQSAFQSGRDLELRLKSLLAESAPAEPEILDLLDKRAALDEAEHKREQAFVQAVRKLLSPRQQAQFLLFRQKFRGWLEQRLREMREVRQRGAARPGGRGAPGRLGAGGSNGAALEDEWDETLPRERAPEADTAREQVPR